MLLDDFDRWVELCPEAIAIRGDARSVRYVQLQALAHTVASALLLHGVGVGDRVALYLPKGITAIAQVLGVLYAGAAYVPLDPRTPCPRVAQIIESCAPRALIGHTPLIERLAAFDPHLLDAVEALFVDVPGPDRAIVLDPNATTTQRSDLPRPLPNGPAYLLYTSGSTGTPKGVVVSHQAAQSFVDWARRAFALTHGDRLANFAPLSFDLSVFDVFCALASGASVDLVTPQLLLRPEQLVHQLSEWRTTTIYAVPSTITWLEREGKLADANLKNLRQVLYAGEPFAIAPLVAAMQAVPWARFYNLFGPTETNVCTYHPIEEIPSLSEKEVPIGTGCDHLTVELLDEAANPVPLGQEGELCVAGPSLMTEYFGEARATLDAFHPPESFVDGQKRYRTGDRAVADPLGQFWFRGRRDRLIKRRGYRIELGDIEAALLRHPSIQEAAAVAELDGTETRIRVFVALSVGGALTPLILRAHCGSLLPPYMVPDAIEVIEVLPRTLTGKVDMQLLQDRGRAS
jgi:amino acid adenylation domain-containing protein